MRCAIVNRPEPWRLAGRAGPHANVNAMRIAYLINQYPKISHAFLRREILAAEREGVEGLRCGIRRPNEPAVDALDAAEALRTHVVLDAGGAALFRAFWGAALTRPLRFVRALIRALRLGLGSQRGLLRHLVCLAEAALLVGWSRRGRVERVHAQFGTNSATVAMLCHALGGPTYSYTVHGPEAFDEALRIGRRQKIDGSAFVVAVSRFGRSQLHRHMDYHDDVAVIARELVARFRAVTGAVEPATSASN